MAITIDSLTLYPVKSCAGIPVRAMRLGAAGPDRDREWMIVDETGKFVTQRELPALALVRPGLLADSLRLEHGSHGIGIPLAQRGAKREVAIWDSPVNALDEGDAAAAWLTERLGRALRLVRIGPALHRREGKDPRTVRFVDSYPLHLASLASLADLNRRMAAPLGIERFRANIVVRGGAAWDEDRWKAVSVAGASFPIGKRCERCTITTVDPVTASKGPEPLRTLAGFRRNARNKIEFGQYLHSPEGITLEVGMEVAPLLG